MTFSILTGIELFSFRRYSWLSPLTHSFLMASVSLGTELMSSFLRCSFIYTQQFSMGFRSGLFPSQSMTLKFWVARKVLILFEAWQGESGCSHGCP